MAKTTSPTVTNVLTMLVAFIIAVIPFHAFITVWLASLLGHYTLIRLWKEVLLSISICLALYLLIESSDLRKQFTSNKLHLLIFGYGLLLTFVGLLALVMQDVAPKALAYGLLIDGRFLVFMLVAWIASMKSQWLYAVWHKLVLIPAAIVVLFGLMQHFLLPYDFLKHFGYSNATIKPYETVDQKLAYVRTTSTLRGANPLGAYLVLPISIATAKLGTNGRKRILVIGLAAVALIVLFYTYSRSAWIGGLLSMVAIAFLNIQSRRLRIILASAAVVMASISGGITFALRHNDQFQNTLFHTDEHSRSTVSSNSGHTAAVKGAIKDIIHQPLGRGPGTAGPASVYNNHRSRISENYFLQIGQEAGVLGLLLFLGINVVVAYKLWLRRAQPLALVLFASLIGISFINLLSHAWADDTLAYLWWGLTGISLGTGEYEQFKR